MRVCVALSRFFDVVNRAGNRRRTPTTQKPPPKSEESCCAGIRLRVGGRTDHLPRILKLSRRTDCQRAAGPQSGAILVITNAGARENVDNAVTAPLVVDRQRPGTAHVVTFELASSLDLEHNYVDPDAPHQSVDVVQVVHPLLVELIDQLAEPGPQAGVSRGLTTTCNCGRIIACWAWTQAGPGGCRCACHNAVLLHLP